MKGWLSQVKLTAWTVALAAVTAAILLSVVVFQGAASAAPRAAQDEGAGAQEVVEAIEAASAWLLATHQNADGGFSSFSGGADLAPSDIGGTLDALWALSMAQADTGAAVAYLEENADQLADYVAQDGSTAGKALLALVPLDVNLKNFAGLDLEMALTAHYSPTGAYGVNTAFNQSLAIMGLEFTGQQAPEEAVQWLAALQASEGELAGSWDDGFGTAGNIDSTALALVAMRMGGLAPDDPAIQAGIEFLAQAQLDSGGWEYAAGFGENANSTAMALLALTILGEDVLSADSRWVKEGVNPIQALLAWQGDSGAFQADLGDGPSDDFFSTVQALPVLGFSQLFLGRGPVQAPVVDGADAAALEMTPTATVAAAAAEEPTAPPEPTATATPEVVAEEAATGDGQADATGSEGVAESDAAVEGEDEGSSSIALWVVLIGGVFLIVGLAWWALSRRKEA